MPRVWDKLKGKLSHRPATPPPARPVSAADTSSAPATSAHPDESSHTSQLTPFDGIKSTAQLPVAAEPEAEASSEEEQQSVRNAVWHAAYEKLCEEEEDLVRAYEKTILKLRVLHGGSLPQNPPSSADKPEKWQIIQDGIKIGLERTEKEAKIKRQMGEVVRLADNVRGLISSATKHSPEAALAWSCFCLTAEILANPIHESAAQRDGLKYIAFKMEWYWHLTDILFPSKGSAAHHAGLEGKLKESVISLYKKCLSFQLRSVRVYHQSRVLTALGDFVKYMDWADQVQGIKDEELKVERMCQQFNNEQFKQILQLIPESIHEFLDAFQDWTAKQEDEECRSLVAKSIPSITKQNIMERKGQLFTTCCDWFFRSNEFQTWQSSEMQNILLITGGPGRGKTMLLCALIEWLQDYRGLAYFFCVATDSTVNSQTAILQGLIYAIILKVPGLLEHVRQNKDGLKLQGENLETALFNTLKAILTDPLMTDGIIVIDALDECHGSISRILKLIHTTSSSKAKWVISCRPNETKVETELSSNHPGFLHTKLDDELPSDAVDEFVRREIDEFSSLWVDEEPEPTTIEEICSELVEKAGGTYLWVSLVLSDIRRELENTEIFTSVLSFVGKKVKEKPASLTAMYETMMKEVNDNSDSSFYRDLLKLVYMVFRPLTLREIQYMSAKREIRDIKSMDRLKRLIVQRGSFLSYSAELGTITFVHQSAKDFISERGSDAYLGILSDCYQLDHIDLFRRSVCVMSELLHKDMYKLRHPGRRISDIDRPEPDPLAPMAYSCLHWLEHFMLAIFPHLTDFTDAKQVYFSDCAPVATEFFSAYSLNWLEALSLLGSLSKGIPMLRDLKHSLNLLEAKELLPWVSDIQSFLIKFRQPAETYPLQLYVSGLTFAPSNSLLRKVLHHIDSPSWITRVSGVATDWERSVLSIEHSQIYAGAQCFWDESDLLCVISQKQKSRGVVQVYDLDTGEMIRRRKMRLYSRLHFLTSIERASRSNNRRMVAWQDEAGNLLHIWNVRYGDNQKITLSTSEERLTFDFSKDFRYLIAWAKSSLQLHVWDTLLENKHHIIGKSEGQDDFCFLSNTVFLCYQSDAVYLSDVHGKKVGGIRVSDGVVVGVKTFAESQTRFLTYATRSSDDPNLTTQVWDIEIGECIWTFQQKKPSRVRFNPLLVSPNGQLFACYTPGPVEEIDRPRTPTVLPGERTYKNTEHICIWNIQDSRNFSVISFKSQGYRQLKCFSSTSQYLFAWAPEGAPRIAVMDPIRGTILGILEVRCQHIDFVTTCPFDRYLAVGLMINSTDSIKIWDLSIELSSQQANDLQEMRSSLVLRNFESQSQIIEISEDAGIGPWLLDESPCSSWGAISNNQKSTGVPGMTVSNDGRKLAVYGNARNLEVWESVAESDELVKTRSLKGLGYVIHAAFSKNGLFLATSDYWQVILRRFAERESTCKLSRGLKEAVEAITFLYRDDMLAVAWHGSIRFYDTTGAETGTVSSIREPIRVMESIVVHDKELLVSASPSCLRVWDVTDLDSIKLAHEFGISHGISHILPYPDNPLRLRTSLGDLDLSEVFALKDSDSDTVDITNFFYGVGFTESWVTKDGKRVLWLPLGHRPLSSTEIVIVGLDTAVIGRGFGGKTVLQIDSNNDTTI